jgi:hypothetical protein
MKVVGREAYDDEAFFPVGLMESFEAFKLGCVAAVTGGVDDEQRAPCCELTEVDRFTGPKFLEIVIKKSGAPPRRGSCSHDPG